MLILVGFIGVIAAILLAKVFLHTAAAEVVRQEGSRIRFSEHTSSAMRSVAILAFISIIIDVLQTLFYHPLW